jgi:hypothetical protein
MGFQHRQSASRRAQISPEKQQDASMPCGEIWSAIKSSLGACGVGMKVDRWMSRFIWLAGSVLKALFGISPAGVQHGEPGERREVHRRQSLPRLGRHRQAEACRGVGVSACRRVGVSACRRVGVSACRCVRLVDLDGKAGKALLSERDHALGRSRAILEHTDTPTPPHADPSFTCLCKSVARSAPGIWPVAKRRRPRCPGKGERAAPGYESRERSDRHASFLPGTKSDRSGSPRGL